MLTASQKRSSATARREARGGLMNVLMVGGLALFLLLLPFHLVVKRLLPDPVGTYWKEGLLALLVVLWAVQCVRARRLLVTNRSLDAAVWLYLGLILLRFVLDRSGAVGEWGLYLSVMYLPLFWLVPAAFRHHSAWITAFMVLLVGVGALAALGGLVEFALNVPLWPSVETVQRQGFPDVFIYGTQIRRVYFTFDSPTTLANTLAMLLPLALALLLLSRGTVPRVAAGFATALLAGCIVVTFSRGIWVASVLSLAMMAWAASRMGPPEARSSRGNGRARWQGTASVALVGCAAVVLFALAGAGMMAIQRDEQATAYGGVIELSPTAYQAAPVTMVQEELLKEMPAHGRAVTQIWSLVDPITSQDDVRPVLYHHPPQTGKDEIIYVVRVPVAGALRFAIALSPQTWSPQKGDGASFQIYLSEPGAGEDGQFLFVRYINPKHNPSDRRWRNYLVDLAPWAGRTVHLSFITEAGPAGDWAFDWAGWAEPEVVRVVPGYFATAKRENAILRHTRSIFDWARDETNRDRLAAWSQALNAWRAAPLWGQGLGTTGAAALRTRPGQAFVTESQVLKALVELGLLGLAALTWLWWQIARVGWQAYRTADSLHLRVLLLGILTSLLVVFVEGWVYQNLEVKQVNAYFWTLIGTLAFLTREGANGR